MRFEAKREGQAVVLEVSDTGPGIPADERAHVFERFVRGRAASAQPGSGLGLSVAKALADAEGAVVTLTDAPAGGTRVTVTFAPRPNNYSLSGN